MGGASAEIAFSVAPNSGTSRYYVTETLLKKKENLYARSYLCYGHTQAKGRFLAHLYTKNVSRHIVIVVTSLPNVVYYNFTTGK